MGVARARTLVVSVLFLYDNRSPHVMPNPEMIPLFDSLIALSMQLMYHSNLFFTTVNQNIHLHNM